MKKEFDKVKPVEFTGLDGVVVQVYRADIASVAAAPKSSEANSIIVLKVCERHSEGGSLLLQDDIQKVIDVLNGRPDPELIGEWEVDLLEKRVIATKAEIIEANLQKAISSGKMEHGYRKTLTEIKDEKQQIETSLAASRKAIQESPRLRFAVRMNAFADSLPQDSFRQRMVFRAAEIIGRDGMGHIDYVDTHKNTPASYDRVAASMENDRDNARAALDRKYAREIESLERLSAEPQMTAGDRAVLNDKIEKHRVGHAEPEFTFVRDPKGESYRPQTELEQERRVQMLERMRERGISQERQRQSPGMSR